MRLEELANKFPQPILFESRRRKLQRFLELPSLTLETIWFPIFKDWLTRRWAIDEVLYIAIDRTRWGCINLIMISLIVDHRAIPIYFELLDHVGNSDLETQQALLSRVLPLLKGYKKVLTGRPRILLSRFSQVAEPAKKDVFLLTLETQRVH